MSLEILKWNHCFWGPELCNRYFQFVSKREEEEGGWIMRTSCMCVNAWLCLLMVPLYLCSCRLFVCVCVCSPWNACVVSVKAKWKAWPSAINLPTVQGRESSLSCLSALSPSHSNSIASAILFTHTILSLLFFLLLIKYIAGEPQIKSRDQIPCWADYDFKLYTSLQKAHSFAFLVTFSVQFLQFSAIVSCVCPW